MCGFCTHVHVRRGYAWTVSTPKRQAHSPSAGAEVMAVMAVAAVIFAAFASFARGKPLLRFSTTTELFLDRAMAFSMAISMRSWSSS